MQAPELHTRGGGPRYHSLMGVLFAVLLLLAPPASADDVSGYVIAMEKAELIDHDSDPYHCNDQGRCYGQFDDADASLQTGRWVCSQLQGGKPRDLLVEWLSNGEGLMPSTYSAPIIVDAAKTHLCP